MLISPAERRPGQRVVALVAAYVIALASLLAAYTSARAASDTATAPFNIICHTVLDGQTAPADGQNDHQACCHNCCVGCLMLTAALPPPPAQAAAAPQSASQSLTPLASAVLATDPSSKSHCSRAPPLPA